MPIGVLVYRLNSLIYANRAFLEWTGYSTLEALNEAGGLDSLFIESTDKSSAKDTRNGKITHDRHNQRHAEASRRPLVQRDLE